MVVLIVKKREKEKGIDSAARLVVTLGYSGLKILVC
jgi:hypothetical protein